VASRAPVARRADVAAVQGVVAHWAEVLVRIGYLDPTAPKKLLPRLNQALNRAGVTDEEVHILRGVARAVDCAARPGTTGVQYDA
jgi:tRNA/rRNA methyltransferase